MLISSPRTQNQPELNQGGRGRRGRDVDWGDVQWLVDRSDDQWRMFETRIVGIFTEQSGKLEKKLDAQEEKLGKKLDAQDKKLDAQEEKLGKKLDAQEEKLGKKLDAQDKKLDAQEEKLGKKLDAQEEKLGKKLDAQDKKLDAQGEKFGVVSAKISKVEVGVSAIVAFFVIVNFFFKDGVGVLEALLRFARGE